jgi:hypothetical protein
MIGFVLNCLSYFILSKIKRKTKKILYSYLTIYTLFSMSICILNTLLAILSSPRYFDFIFTEPASIVKCNLLSWTNSSNYFFLNILDCILLLERLTAITKNATIKSFFNYNPNLICFFVFLASNLLNITSFFITNGRSDMEYNQVVHDLDKLTNFTYCYRQPFFSNQIGRSLVVVTIALRDFVTLLIEFILSLYSIIIFKRYIKQQSMESHSIQTINSSGSQNQIEMIKKIEKYNINLTKMTIFLSMCSTISHIGVAMFYVQLSNSSNDENTSFIRQYSAFVSICLVNLKCLSNFFLYYNFNLNFKYFFRNNTNFVI